MPTKRDDATMDDPKANKTVPPGDGGAVDFVLTWVDGADPAWRESRRRFLHEAGAEAKGGGGANAECRYRDFGTLRHWFRAVEACAPWVRRVFLVTAGQAPDWLDRSCPKLRLVDHRDFIPAAWLPTFNARPIELNLHRIADLAERFVLFNDDMFLLRPVGPDFFFRRGLPRLPADLGYPRRVGYNNSNRTVFNDYALVHGSLDVARLLRRRAGKWIAPLRLGPARAAKNLLCLLANGTIPVKPCGHLPTPHLKSTLAEMWERRPDVLEATCSRRFRADDQVNQWASIAWNLATGRFSPVHGRGRGLLLDLTTANLPAIEDAIARRAAPQICVNDTDGNDDPERTGTAFVRALDAAFPNPSSFEKA
ncbi:MAG: Stealth CR1 domain-containing protein [Kiritimatiellae bacterium]|nr:Stealth CR1 domain-containing protein [Kiritimatiellia bacterium]